MAEPAIDTDFIRERLAFFKGARFKTWLDICAHCGYCSDSCFFYTAH
ncbi:MAG: (Fe-S)-binding protein, partial [Deltaproteobacteria bacterium]|nr:(Fe-S)-binding protein [Deltaproteobacteria bacterium]